jgi:hypothetical protein
MTRAAHCACRQCAIVVTGDPDTNAICHCDDCKRRTGSAFGWSAYFADSQIVEKTGPLTLYRLSSGTPQQRWFCTQCGSTLFWVSGDFPNMTGIAGGCFTDPVLPSPNLTVSMGAKHPWVGLPSSWETDTSPARGGGKNA